jgi:transcriptional regulator with XRE-family HTH domain
MEKIMINIQLVSRFQWHPENGMLLKAKRTDLKISRAAFSGRLITILKNHQKPEGLSTKYIERLEKGTLKTISLESLLAIASVLNVGAEELLSQKDTIKIFSKESLDF